MQNPVVKAHHCSYELHMEGKDHTAPGLSLHTNEVEQVLNISKNSMQVYDSGNDTFDQRLVRHTFCVWTD